MPLNDEVANLKLFDWDGSLSHPTFQGSLFSGSGIFPQKLIRSNNYFFDQLLLDININEYLNVVLGLGTARQDFETDRGNTYPTCLPSLPSIQTYFSRNSSATILIDIFMMADLFKKNIKEGDSYTKAMIVLSNLKDLENHARWFFDHTKFTLIYTHINRFRILNPTAQKWVVDFYDDRLDILNGLINIFDKYSKYFLPQKMSFNFYLYNGKKLKKIRSFEGECENIDHHYAWSVRYFAFSVTSKRKYNSFESEFAELTSFHLTEGYNFNEGIETIQIELMERFLEFRNQLLTMPPVISTNSCYLSQANIHQRISISPHYDIDASFLKWNRNKIYVYEGLALIFACFLYYMTLSKLPVSFSISLSLGILLLNVVLDKIKVNHFPNGNKDVLSLANLDENRKTTYSFERFFQISGEMKDCKSKTHSTHPSLLTTPTKSL